MLGGLGTGEILLIFLIVLLVFGAKRIPEIAQGLGRGMREFRKAVRDVREEIDVNAPPTTPPAREQQPPAQEPPSQPPPKN
jgi:TatA/E family protein of Tat protein translocase